MRNTNWKAIQSYKGVPNYEASVKQMSSGSWHADASQEGKRMPEHGSRTKPPGRVPMIRIAPPIGGWNVDALKGGGWDIHRSVGRTVAS